MKLDALKILTSCHGLILLKKAAVRHSKYIVIEYGSHVVFVKSFRCLWTGDTACSLG